MLLGKGYNELNSAINLVEKGFDCDGKIINDIYHIAKRDKKQCLLEWCFLYFDVDREERKDILDMFFENNDIKYLKTFFHSTALIKDKKHKRALKDFIFEKSVISKDIKNLFWCFDRYKKVEDKNVVWNSLFLLLQECNEDELFIYLENINSMAERKVISVLIFEKAKNNENIEALTFYLNNIANSKHKRKEVRTLLVYFALEQKNIELLKKYYDELKNSFSERTKIRNILFPIAKEENNIELMKWCFKRAEKRSDDKSVFWDSIFKKAKEDKNKDLLNWLWQNEPFFLYYFFRKNF